MAQKSLLPHSDPALSEYEVAMLKKNYSNATYPPTTTTTNLLVVVVVTYNAN